MSLGKLLRLGGIDNRPPKTDQSVGGFRVARNVMPTPDMTLVPRNEFDEYVGGPTTAKSYEAITSYNNLPLALTSDGVSPSKLKMYANNILVAGRTGAARIYSALKSVNNHSVLTTRNKNTTYFLVPEQQLNLDTPLPSNYALLKYDGIEVSRAGTPQPMFAVANTLTGTARFIRVIQHMIDFDNNEPVSEFVEFWVTATANIPILMTSGAPALSRKLPGDYVNTQPKNNLLRLDYPPYFIGTNGTITATEIEVVVTDTNIVASDIGTFLIVIHTAAGMLSAGFVNGELGLALKINSVSPLKLSLTIGHVLNANREWVPLTGTAGPNLTYGSKTFFSFWESVSATGVYYFRSIAPSFPDSVSTSAVSPATFTLVTTGTAVATAGSDANIFTFGPSLNEWFDVNSRKLDPNAYSYPWGDVNPYCMTSFQRLLLIASDDLIYFSDTTLGGVFEQFNQGSFIQVGDKEDGRIVSIAGSEDFLIVSRERKNYYVVGDIATGSYRVQVIPDIETGTWSNSSAISIKGTIFLLTATGLFQISIGGRATFVSELCPKNFSRYNTKGVNEDVAFILEGFNADITDTTIDGISMAFDNYRDLLLIMRRGVNGNASLLVHTKTGNIYEWNGLFEEVVGSKANCAVAIQASFYLGGIDKDPLTAVTKMYKENNSSALRYPANYPIKLYTAWLTGGEPSLEKEVLQLKLFGRIYPGTGLGLKIRQYNDWNRNDLITDTKYIPTSSVTIPNQVQYSHKKRLNSSKALASSIGVEITDDASFELESMEVEFNPIQQGVKR